jgi:hypothetical protein
MPLCELYCCSYLSGAIAVYIEKMIPHLVTHEYGHKPLDAMFPCMLGGSLPTVTDYQASPIVHL